MLLIDLPCDVNICDWIWENQPHFVFREIPF